MILQHFNSKESIYQNCYIKNHKLLSNMRLSVMISIIYNLNHETHGSNEEDNMKSEKKYQSTLSKLLATK